jgi:hypothetical protein
MRTFCERRHVGVSIAVQRGRVVYEMSLYTEWGKSYFDISSLSGFCMDYQRDLNELEHNGRAPHKRIRVYAFVNPVAKNYST